jgi:hypothetical protein
MKGSTHLIFAVILAISAAGLGCASGRHKEGPQPALRVAKKKKIQLRYNNVVFLDRGLPKRIEVQRSDARRTPTNTIEVLVVFRNRTDYPQQIECRAQYYDSGGVALGEPGAWKRVHLEANTILQWSDLSLSPLASHYYVEVREGR